jgi:hypothetical protein
MFALGIVALVLKTTLDLILFNTSINDALYGVYIDGAYYYVWATITCLMVRLHMLSCCLLDSIYNYIVYSMRYNLRLAHGGPLEQ